jgi:predicted AAA+ superfamily ATPase
LCDKRGHELKILITGSGHLDYYRHGGESLQGRYHLYRLYPFSLREVEDYGSDPLADLLRYGGFPEPFLSSSEREARRWSREYRTRLVYDDLSSLENVREIALVEELVLRLPALVGSPLSVNALREDLQVSHQSVSRWLNMLERVYAIFRIYPFGVPRVRAVKKRSKHYHFDWTLVEEMGPRFENLVGFHLLKWAHFLQDYEGLDVDLKYFRTKDGREVDFVVVQEGEPRMFVECKLKAREVNPALRYLKRKFPKAEAFQVCLESSDDYVTKDGIRVCPAATFLLSLV